MVQVIPIVSPNRFVAENPLFLDTALKFVKFLLTEDEARIVLISLDEARIN